MLGCLNLLNQNFWNDAATYTAPYAGLTRVSITLRKSLSKKMDCRIKPGNDEFSCPGRDAAFFMPLRRTGTPVSSGRK
jgi:hypothetical protein